jgi:Novel STAND NTPase 1
MFDREEIKRLINQLQQSQRIPPGIITMFYAVAGIIADLKLGDQYRYWILGIFLAAVTSTWLGFRYYRRRYGYSEHVGDPSTPMPKEREVTGGWLVGARQLGLHDRMFDPDSQEARSLFALVASPAFRIGSLWGPAGVGKSSLLQKGLRETCPDDKWCLVYVPQPGADPVARTVDILRSMLPKASVAKTLSPSKRLHGLVDALNESSDAAGAPRQVLIVLDQFEQFLIAKPDVETRKQLFAPFAELAAGPPPAPRILLALRKEFVADLDSLADFETGVSNPEFRRALPPWSRAKVAAFLRQVVENKEAGFADELIEAIASDLDLANSPGQHAGEAGLATGVLPIQLQLVARVLKERRVRTLQEYQSSGGALDALRSVIRDTLSPPGTPSDLVQVRVGNHLLRVFCERDASGARAVLKVSEIVRRVEARLVDEGGDRRNPAQVERDVNFQLERLQARTILIRPTPDGYCLAHDYLELVIGQVTTGVDSAKTRAARLIHAIRSQELGRTPVLLPFSSIRLIQEYGMPDVLRDPKVRNSVLLTRAFYVGIAATLILALGIVLTVSLPFGGAIRVDELATLNKAQDWSYDRARSLVSVITNARDGTAEVQVWNIANVGKAKLVLRSPASAAILSPDGKYLALIRDARLYLLAASSPVPSPLPKPLASFDKQPPKDPAERVRDRRSLLRTMAFSHDGMWLLVIGLDKTISVVDTTRSEATVQPGTVNSKDIEEELSWHRISVVSAKSQNVFAVCDASHVHFIFPNDPKRNRSIDSKQSRKRCTFEAGDQYLAAAGDTNNLTLYPVAADAKPIALQFPGPAGRSDQVLFRMTADANYVAGRVFSSPFAAWDLRQGEPSESLTPINPHSSSFDSDRKSITASSDGKWFGGLAYGGDLLVWRGGETGPQAKTRRIMTFRDTGIGREGPLLAFGKGSRALISTGRGQLLQLMLDQPDTQPQAISRVFGQDIKLYALENRNGWLAVSAAEVQLLFDGKRALSSDPTGESILETIPTSSNDGLIGLSDSKLLGFRFVFNFWGFPIRRYDWPRLEHDGPPIP